MKWREDYQWLKLILFIIACAGFAIWAIRVEYLLERIVNK